MGGGTGPECSECGLSTWVEIGGGVATDVYRPNLDIQEHPNVDIVIDLEEGVLPFHDGHAERVKMVHGINHISRKAARMILRECHRILRTGGTIYLMYSDTDFVIERLVEDGLQDCWLNCLYHADEPTPGGFHKWAYNWTTIQEELAAAGFGNIGDLGPYNAWERKCQAVRP